MLSLLVGEDDRPALVDADTGRRVTYAELRGAVARRAEREAGRAGTVALLGMANDVASVVAELALVEAGVVVALLDPASPREVVAALAEAYAAEAVEGFRHHPDRLLPPDATAERVAGPERVLLPTSGTTGSPKVVRLSRANVAANAEQIATALRLAPEERGLAALPLFYSYGLSVLHSHLRAGATVVLTATSAMHAAFVGMLREHEVTSLPGVPSSYELYRRVGLLDADLPRLRHLTQAGGRLPPERVRDVHARASARGADLWIMYGQTEATARIAVLEPGELPEQVGSVGRPLPGGAVRIDDPGPDGVGQVVYEGPNVMLGYASDRAGLDGSDTLGGVLPTGDLGRLDAGGRLWLTGRIKRITKVAGLRVSLDDVEDLARPATVAALDGGDGMVLFVVGDAPAEVARRVERALGFPPRTVVARAVDALPLTAAGKVDYGSLRDAL